MNGAGILSDRAIADAVARGVIAIDPFDAAQLNPASYDLTLGDKVVVYSAWVSDETNPLDAKVLSVMGIKPNPIDGRHVFVCSDDVLDVKQPPTTKEYVIGEDGWVLKPGILYLMHTRETIAPGKLVACVDGKALALNTEVPTPCGWKMMGDLCAGDYVYGADGHPTKIVNTTKTMLDRPCFRVTFTDRTEIVADAAHQWFVHPAKTTRRKPDIYTTAQMWEQGVRRRSGYLFQVAAAAVMGEEIPLPIAPYAFGVWLGDGTSSNSNVTINDLDKQILGEISKDGYTVEVRAKKGRSTTYIIDRKTRVQGHGGRFVSDNGSFQAKLRILGVLDDKHIPDAYKRSSFSQRWALLQGLMDTDGTVHRDDQASITLTNERLFNDVEELFRSLGLVTYRDERPAKLNGRIVGTAYRLTWRATPEMFRTRRKQSRVRTTDEWLQSARNPLRTITAIDPISSVPVRCIEVEAKDGLFLVSRAFIPTHNSSIGRLGIFVHATAGYVDPGFCGQLTLEVNVVHPVRVYAGMRIAQLRFHTVYGESSGYRGNYVGEHAQGPVPSRIWKQFVR